MTNTESPEAESTEAESPETTETPAEVTDPEETPTEGESGNREAAKYRRRLREAEAERDTLRGQVETLQRAAVESVAGKHLSKPESLWVAGVELADVLDADGRPDPEKVTTAARNAAETLGLARPPKSHVVPGEGKTPGHGSSGTRFEDALRNA